MSAMHKALNLVPRPLIHILLLAVVAVVVAVWLSKQHDKYADAYALTTDAVAARLQPVGQVLTEAPPAPVAAAAAGLKSGGEVYQATCVACHGAGIAGAPRLGDRAAWGPRIATGFDTLVKHANEGFQGKSGVMPAKGGGTYDPIEVARAVAWMADQAGASFKEPAAARK